MNMVRIGYDCFACKCFDTPEELDWGQGGIGNARKKEKELKGSNRLARSTISIKEQGTLG
jgi:hypothetical protein